MDHAQSAFSMSLENRTAYVSAVVILLSGKAYHPKSTNSIAQAF